MSIFVFSGYFVTRVNIRAVACAHFALHTLARGSVHLNPTPGMYPPTGILMSASANDRSHFVRPHLICSVVTPAPPLESRRTKGLVRRCPFPGAILRGGGGCDGANEMRAGGMGTVICGRRH